MSKLSDKQMLLVTMLVPALLVGGVGYMAWADYQKVHAAEVTEQDPEAAEVTDPELWGENRKCQEFRKEMATLQGEADKIAERERDVIVYREIVQRDSKILPDKDLVNQLTTTINEFEKTSGVMVTSVADLNLTGEAGQAIRKLPIRLSLSGTFDQFLKFLNLFETMDRIVNTRSFTITTGARATAESGEPLHSISLELETYVYNPGAGLAKPVEIQGYERRKDDPVIQKLVRQQKAARVETYALRPRINRRDPLVDPRRSQVGPEEGAVSQEAFDEMRRLVDRLKVDVETLKEDVRLEQQYMQEQKYLQYVQLNSLNDEKIQQIEIALKDGDPRVTVPELREIFQEEVVSSFTRLSADRTKSARDQVPEVLKTHVAEFLEKQRTAYENRDFKAVVAVLHDFESFVAQGKRKVSEDAAPLVADLRDRAREASVMIEFLALNLRVAGIIRRERGSVVLLGDKSRKVGDFVDAQGRCRLIAINEDALVFDYDGYEIAHPLDKK